MNTKDHYNKHLGNFYAWMVGDMSPGVTAFTRLLVTNNLVPGNGELAIDLGAGHGIQTLALLEGGYRVTAIDFNDQLVRELSVNTQGKDIKIVNDDIRNVRQYATHASLVVCCGDTITHLHSQEEIGVFVGEIYQSLRPGGKAIFSFRDYAVRLEGEKRFIPVKSDTDRILTCVLDYGVEFVTVTDLLHERVGAVWHQKVSSYNKVRLDKTRFINMLVGAGFKITADTVADRMVTVVVAR